jgi:hypothetical protein
MTILFGKVRNSSSLRYASVGMTILFGTFSVSAGSRTLSSIDCEYSTHFRVSGVVRLVKSGIS